MTLVGSATGNINAGQIQKAYRASIFEHASKTYAVVTKNQTAQTTGGFVVVDLSDPTSPTIVSEKTDLQTGDNDNPSNNWELLNGSFDVATAIVDSVPYAVISQNLGSVNSKGGITIVKLTNNAGNITSTSPSVVQQIQDGDDSFHGSNKTQFKNARGLALQQLGEKTYLFTTGSRNTDDKGFLQVYDFGNLIDGNNGNDTSALVSEIDDSTNERLGESWDIKTFSESGKAYALITSQEAESACSGTSTFHQPFEFNPSENSLQKAKTPVCWPGRVTSGVAVGTLGEKRYVAVVSKDDDPGHTQSQPALAIYDYTDPSNPSEYLDALLPDDSNSFLEGVSQIALTEVDGKYYVILPNSKSGSNRVEFIEFKPTELNPGTGRLGKFYYDSRIADGSQDLDGATFSTLATAVDGIPFTIASKSYVLITSKGDQAIQIIQLSQPAPSPSPTLSPTPTPSVPPKFTRPPNGFIAEQPNSSELTTKHLSGNLNARDLDTPKLDYSIYKGSTLNNYSSLAGKYGTLRLDTRNGDYSYTPNTSAIEALNDGDKHSDVFRFRVSDTQSALINWYFVDIHGADDAPVLKAAKPGSIAEKKQSTKVRSSALSGQIDAADADGDNLSFAITGGITKGNSSRRSGSYGSLSLHRATGAYTYKPDVDAIEALSKNQTAIDSFTITVSDGRLSSNTTYSVNLTGADDVVNIYSKRGKNILKGAPGRTNFIFNIKEKLNKDNADIIVDFKKRQGDLIQLDGDLHNLPDDPKFKRTRNRRKLVRLAQSNVDIVYFKNKHLYLNTNGKEKGYGDPGESGLLAILKGKPQLGQNSLEII